MFFTDFTEPSCMDTRLLPWKHGALLLLNDFGIFVYFKRIFVKIATTRKRVEDSEC